MKFYVSEIDWRRYRYELPDNDIVEISDSINQVCEAVKQATIELEIIKALRARHGFTPGFFKYEEIEE